MLAGCHCKFRGKEFALFSLSYIADQLALSYNIDGSDNWKMCFYIHGVSLPTSSLLNFVFVVTVIGFI